VEVSLSVSPFIDSVGQVVGTSVSARKTTERERLESNFQALLEAAPDAVVGVADDGRVVLANTQAEQLFGLARHGLIGKPIESLISGGLPESGPPRATTGAAPAAQQDTSALLARRVDGGTVAVEVTTSVLDLDNGPVRCAIIRDITDRLAAQAEQVRLRAEAERVKLESRLQRTERLESLGQLAGGIAHDFNNLIGVILNYTAFIQEEALDRGLEGVAGDAEQVIRAGQRGAELTHQLLAFARREVVRPRTLDLNAIVRDVQQLLRRSLGEHVTLRTRLTEQLPSVTADPGQLEQILVNLAVNARDAMPGGGQLTIDTSIHDVDAEDAAGHPGMHPGRYVRLRVSDTGVGMPREVIERAFEPFYTTKPTGEGTGLGLATVYGIITQAGGDIRIYSEPGMGTTFTIRLPASDQPPTHDYTDPQEQTAAGHGETILVVEDEPALRAITCRVLTSAGYHVLAAEHGPAAINLADHHPGRVDLLLTDVVMPHMLGKELATRIGATSPGTALLYMSGYAQPFLASQGTLDPDVMLLEKPFTRSELLTAVRHRLDTTPTG
jgi:hypothetical protein